MKWVQARIGGRQLEFSYVWKTLLLHSHTKGANNNNFTRRDAALYVAGGSDAPIESPNPFTGMYDAMFRTNKQRLNAAQGDTEVMFKPEECLSFSQALWIYTIGKLIYLHANSYFRIFFCVGRKIKSTTILLF